MKMLFLNVFWLFKSTFKSSTLRELVVHLREKYIDVVWTSKKILRERYFSERPETSSKYWLLKMLDNVQLCFRKKKHYMHDDV